MNRHHVVLAAIAALVFLAAFCWLSSAPVLTVYLRCDGEISGTVNEDNVPGSAVPFTRIRQKGNQLIFSFTKDLLMLQTNGEYKTIPKDRLRYRYNGKRLEKMSKSY